MAVSEIAKRLDRSPSRIREYLRDDLAEAESKSDETFGALPDLELPNRDEWDRAADRR